MVGLGALGGAVMAFVTQGFDMYKEHKNRKYEIELLDRQAKLAKGENEKDVAVAGIESYVEDMVSARLHDVETAKLATAKWVNNLRASVRPILSYYTVIVATVFYFYGTADIKATVIASFMMMMEAIISFYFVGRMIKK